MATVQSEEQIHGAKQATANLNKALIEKARFGSDINFLASPVTGGGITVTRFQQLYLFSIQSGKHQPQDWANDVWNVLSAQKQRLLKEGKTLESAEDNIQELLKQANEFARKRLPILKALEIL
jgi:hypothetical protein